MVPIQMFERLENRFKESFNEIFITTYNDKIFTYGQFWKNSQLIAKEWEKKGAEPGDKIALILPNSTSMLACYLACAIGGFIANPIPPNLIKKDIESRLTLTDPFLVVDTPPILYDNIPNTANNKVRINATLDRGFCIFYTSGTTGKPKGIYQSLASIIGSALGYVKISKMNKSTCIYHILPMFYMAGFFNTFFAPLLSGGRIIEGPLFSPDVMLNFWERPVEKQVNTLCLTPTIATALSGLTRNAVKARKNAANIHTIICTASTLHTNLRKKFFDTFGKPLQDCYGVTELGGSLTVQSSEDALHEENVGRPKDDLEFSFRSVHGGNKEMWIRSQFIMKGYLTDKGLELPVDEQGFFATGDIADIIDGKIIISGRTKDIIVRGAENIVPIVIENEINRVSGVKEVSVIGMPHEFWGEIVVACILLKEGIDEEKLINKVKLHSQKQLSPINQPDRVIAVKELPKSFIGKVQKNLLRDQLMVTFSHL